MLRKPIAKEIMTAFQRLNFWPIGAGKHETVANPLPAADEIPELSFYTNPSLVRKPTDFFFKKNGQRGLTQVE